MSEVRISAEPRTEFGKGGARRTRRAGKIPAVVYGHGEKPRHISLPALGFASIIRNYGMNQVIQLEVTDGSKEMVFPKSVQRDVLKDNITHADLLLVRRGEKLTTEVPLEYTGEVQKGGLPMYSMDSLSVEVDVLNIPDSIEISIDGLAIGSNLHASDVTLPEGIVLMGDPDAVLVAVSEPRAEEEASAEGDEEGDEATDSEG
ncbi:50S ribosomal protein L25/general stress protein Ctc [Natronoglycomyces albus]|uniref:Large ribosomal subunit protein bL25 n=1 Tax=Natronoglycomyces albus TaxID=2811108 RepID=A0A895XLD4_9ACTN|nr:50S ribosomal protein L25/general stress protein Ctc [Natronoglycomyces albus]QSB06144.1 50S ribosomal protein L25/general stress protein Ctc [Natronoglycomyces albus]